MKEEVLEEEMKCNLDIRVQIVFDVQLLVSVVLGPLIERWQW